MQDTGLKSCVNSNFQRFWAKAKEWSFTACGLRGPAVAGRLGLCEIFTRGKLYLGCGGTEPKARWIILCSGSRREQSFFQVFFSVKYCSSGTSKGGWMSMMQVELRFKSCVAAERPMLLVKPAFADGGKWLQELFCNHVPFRWIPKFGFHLNSYFLPVLCF